jgi:hypothetical protein
VIEFREVADELSFDTNAELFKQFRKCLKSTAREEWDLVKDPFIDNPLDNGFIQAQQEWILRYVPQDMFDVQKRYLERLRRPFDMEANIFAHRLQHLNLLLKEFPRTDEQEPLTVHQIKDVFFNAMPPKWQESFLLGNNNFTRHTLAELVKYMALAKGIADKQRANDSGRGGRFGRGRQDSRGGRGGRGGNRSTKRSQTGGYPKTAKRQDTDVCRIHGVDSSHTWYKCFGNPDGPNFKPDFIPRTDTKVAVKVVVVAMDNAEVVILVSVAVVDRPMMDFMSNSILLNTIISLMQCRHPTLMLRFHLYLHLQLLHHQRPWSRITEIIIG